LDLEPRLGGHVVQRTMAISKSTQARVGLWIVIIVAIVMVAARWIGSPILTSVVNKKLAAIPNFEGHVKGVYLALWRSDVSASDFVLSPREHPDAEPLLKIDHAALKFSWVALIKGKLGGRANIDGATLNVLTQEASQAAHEAGNKVKQVEAEHGHPNDNNAEIRQWQDEFRKAFPMEITRFEIKNSRIRFVDKTHQPNPELAIDQFHLVANELSNRSRDGGENRSTATIDGVLTGHGKLHVEATLMPVAPQPKFNVKMQITDLHLNELNNFMQAYLKVDVQSGEFDDYVEINADNGGYEGYTKPFLRDLKFTDAPNDKNVLEKVAAKAANAVSQVLKNKQGKVATKAPFKGNFNDNKVEVWTTIQYLLRNAFVQSLREGIESFGHGDKDNGSADTTGAGK
jgi:hypothetical protein